MVSAAGSCSVGVPGAWGEGTVGRESGLVLSARLLELDAAGGVDYPRACGLAG